MTLRSETKEQFALALLGPGIKHHSISVEALVPSIEALSTLVQRMSRRLQGDQVPVRLYISGFYPGSFELGLFLDQTPQVVAMLGVDGATVIRMMLHILLGTKKHIGLLGLLRELGGRPANVIEESLDGDGRTTVTHLEVDGVKYEATKDTVRLSADKVIFREYHKFTKTLRDHNLDGVSFRREGEEIAFWTPEDSPDADVSLQEARHPKLLVGESQVTQLRRRLTIRDIPFGGLASGRTVKWMLHDGEAAHWYKIADANFLNRVRQGVPFGFNDVLLCSIEEHRRVNRFGETKVERTVTEVIEHTTPGWQIRMEES